ncbi:unnamed protein product, partial [Mycena citricolor]
MLSRLPRNRRRSTRCLSASHVPHPGKDNLIFRAGPNISWSNSSTGVQVQFSNWSSETSAFSFLEVYALRANDERLIQPTKPVAVFPGWNTIAAITWTSHKIFNGPQLF